MAASLQAPTAPDRITASGSGGEAWPTLGASPRAAVAQSSGDGACASSSCATSNAAATARKPLVLSSAAGYATTGRSTEPDEDAATWIAPTEEELRTSRGECCAVCLEPVVQRGCWFGLLDGCPHAFCLPCVRQWRETHAKRPEVARSCPVCRTPSHFVIPSSFLVADERKHSLILGYQRKLRAIPCRHFAYGEGHCPFGTSCFYAHTDRSGRPLVTPGPRQAHGVRGSTVLPTYKLSEFLFPNEGAALLETIPLQEDGV